MLRWISRWFGGGRRAEPARRTGSATSTPAARPGSGERPSGGGGQSGSDSGARRRKPGSGAIPAKAPFSGQSKAELAHREAVTLGRVEHHIDTGKLELPELSPGAMQIVAMVGDKDVEVQDLVDAIPTDPVLSSELLKTANSALYGGHQIDSIREAVTRLGLRRLRSMVYATAMRDVIIGYDTLAEHAAEVWRQAYVAAAIAQETAPRLGLDSERAFMIGLLHDIGRIPLLALLNQEARQQGVLSENLIGRVFNRFHEKAGAAIAREWKLSDEIVAVAGCHHLYDRNESHLDSAALASFAHRCDLILSMGGSDEELMDCPELDYFGLSDERRADLAHSLRLAFEFVSEEQTAAV